ncbi:MAG: hypothetical protein OXG24_05385 [Gammaproteobacteria bacterium]|nr:hypothetical protein [Gammaproteobacteria bacterium]
MKNTHRYLLGIATGVVLVVGGYFLSKPFFKTDDPRAELDPTLRSESPYSNSNQRRNSNNQPKTFGHSNIELLKLSEYSSDFARRTDLYALLARSTTEELLEFLQQSEKISKNSLRRSTQEAIFQRLASLDPPLAIEKMLEYPKSLRAELVLGTFREWSVADLDSAIEGARSLDRFTRVKALETILANRDDLPNDDLVEIAQKVENARYAFEAISEFDAETLIDKPAEAWNNVTSDNVLDSRQIDILSVIASEWVEQAGLEALTHILKSSLGRHDFGLARELVAGIVESDPRSVFEFVISLSSEEQTELLNPLFTTWVRLDPEATFDGLSSFRHTEHFSWLERRIAQTWARHDPKGMLERIDAFSKDSQLNAIEEAVVEVARDSPKDAVEMMDSMAGKVGNISSIAPVLVAVWAVHDPREALDWVLMREQGKESLDIDLMMVGVLVELTHEDPQLAMQIALDRPESGYQLDVTVIEELAAIDIEQAVKLLPKVSEENRRDAYYAVGRQLLQHHDPLRGIGIASNLPDDERDYVQSRIARAWAQATPNKMLEALEDISSERVKSLAAKGLVLMNSWKPVLDNEQLNYVMTLLNDTDLQEVEERLAP